MTIACDSPIKWVGGKSKLRGEVYRRLPKDAECYAEVFAGAGWILFGKKPHPVEVLNDKNGELVNLYRVLKWRSAELLEEVQHLLYSREMFLELRDSEPPAYDELSRAVRFYALIQMAFGAELSRSRNASFGFWNKSPRDLFLNKSLHQIFPAAERLANVFVENLDYADLIRRYDQSRTVFFCDPPYLDTEGYEESFGLDDHQRLSSILRGIQGRFLMTVNDHPCLREFYGGLRIETYEEARALARAQEGRVAAPCLFISNYDPFDGGLFGGEV